MFIPNNVNVESDFDLKIKFLSNSFPSRMNSPEKREDCWSEDVELHFRGKRPSVEEQRILVGGHHVPLSRKVEEVRKEAQGGARLVHCLLQVGRPQKKAGRQQSDNDHEIMLREKPMKATKVEI